MASTSVFISHSHNHADRQAAFGLNDVLRKKGVETLLDSESEHFAPGNPLTNSIKEGIQSCRILLLLWSRAASESAWVQKEWRYAYQQEKRIVPYLLDGTPLPGVLGNLIYVHSNDSKHGHAKLLRAVFGTKYETDDTELFPGRWRVRLDWNGFNDPDTGQNFGVLGLPEGGYEIELMDDGNLRGTFSMGKLSGILESMFSGGSNLWNMKAKVRGGWSYDGDEEVLTLELNAEVMGQSTHEVMTIAILGRDLSSLKGASTDGRSWIVEKIG